MFITVSHQGKKVTADLKTELGRIIKSLQELLYLCGYSSHSIIFYFQDTQSDCALNRKAPE